MLGTSISYMFNGEICVRTIGMFTLRFSHTSSNIVNIIKSTLSDFEIRLIQVISVTTDNGRNLIKTTSLLDACFQNEKQHIDNAHGNEINDDEEFIDADIFDEDYYSSLLTDVRQAFSESFYTDLIHGISCAAHCIRLVVTKAIEKSTQTKELIQKCRSLAKKLRTPTMRSLLNSAGCNMALIDVITRWSSVYSMVRLIYISC